LEVEPGLRFRKIEFAQFLNTLEPVNQGAAMNVQLARCLQRIASLSEISFKRSEQIPTVPLFMVDQPLDFLAIDIVTAVFGWHMVKQMQVAQILESYDVLLSVHLAGNIHCFPRLIITKI